MGDYGVTWDEAYLDVYARGAWARVGSWWSSPDPLMHWNFWAYGGWFDALAIVAGRVLPGDPFAARHLANALVGIAGIAGTARLGRELAGPPGGFLAALLLALAPFWFGHMFNNPKDIPFGAAYVWAVWAATRAAARPDRSAWRDPVRIGAALGLTAGARVAGWILLPAVAWALRRRTKVLVAACALGYVVMLAGWPYAMAHPLTGPWRAARVIAHFTDAAFVPVRFNGAWYRADEIPRSYLPGYLAVTLPEGVLVGLGGLVATTVAGRRRNRGPAAGRRCRDAVIVAGLSVVIPAVVMIARRTILYDGVRHLLFLMPPLCALGAAGLVDLRARLPTRPRVAATVAFVAWAIAQGRMMAILHPHEAVGYNRFTGGLRGADGRWTLDVWGNAYREAIAGLARRLAADASGPPKRPVTLIACPPHFSADRELPTWIRRVAVGRRADFHLSLTDRPCHGTRGTPYVVVERFGVPLAVIRKLP